MPVLRRLWVARFLAVTKLKAWAADTHNSKLTPGFVFRHQLELAVVCAQRSRNRMRRLIQSRSVVQRKSLSSFYHSSLSSLFSLLFCCFLPHFQQPIIPSLPHLLTLLPHVLCAPPSSSHLHLSVCRLPICMSAFGCVGAILSKAAVHAHTCVFFQPVSQPASVCWWRRPAWLECVFCNFLLFYSELQETGRGWEQGKKKIPQTNSLKIICFLFCLDVRKVDFFDRLLTQSLALIFTTPNQCILTHVGARSLTHGFRFSNKRRVVSAAPSASHWAHCRFIQ